ncbi:MAG: hypothetical protein J2P17_15460, partial [Mycobacterium sp.]|nr:hypothetical protein [Mycobacterium sp.]
MEADDADAWPHQVPDGARIHAVLLKPNGEAVHKLYNKPPVVNDQGEVINWDELELAEYTPRIRGPENPRQWQAGTREMQWEDNELRPESVKDLHPADTVAGIDEFEEPEAGYGADDLFDRILARLDYAGVVPPASDGVRTVTLGNRIYQSRPVLAADVAEAGVEEAAGLTGEVTRDSSGQVRVRLESGITDELVLGVLELLTAGQDSRYNVAKAHLAHWRSVPRPLASVELSLDPGGRLAVRLTGRRWRTGERAGPVAPDGPDGDGGFTVECVVGAYWDAIDDAAALMIAAAAGNPDFERIASWAGDVGGPLNFIKMAVDLSERDLRARIKMLGPDGRRKITYELVDDETGEPVWAPIVVDEDSLTCTCEVSGRPKLFGAWKFADESSAQAAERIAGSLGPSSEVGVDVELVQDRLRRLFDALDDYAGFVFVQWGPSRLDAITVNGGKILVSPPMLGARVETLVHKVGGLRVDKLTAGLGFRADVVHAVAAVLQSRLAPRETGFVPPAVTLKDDGSLVVNLEDHLEDDADWRSNRVWRRVSVTHGNDGNDSFVVSSSPGAQQFEAVIADACAVVDGLTGGRREVGARVIEEIQTDWRRALSGGGQFSSVTATITVSGDDGTITVNIAAPDAKSPDPANTGPGAGAVVPCHAKLEVQQDGSFHLTVAEASVNGVPVYDSGVVQPGEVVEFGGSAYRLSGGGPAAVYAILDGEPISIGGVHPGDTVELDPAGEEVLVRTASGDVHVFSRLGLTEERVRVLPALTDEGVAAAVVALARDAVDGGPLFEELHVTLDRARRERTVLVRPVERPGGYRMQEAVSVRDDLDGTRHFTVTSGWIRGNAAAVLKAITQGNPDLGPVVDVVGATLRVLTGPCARAQIEMSPPDHDGKRMFRVEVVARQGDDAEIVTAEIVIDERWLSYAYWLPYAYGVDAGEHGIGAYLSAGDSDAVEHFMRVAESARGIGLSGADVQGLGRILRTLNPDAMVAVRRNDSG